MTASARFKSSPSIAKVPQLSSCSMKSSNRSELRASRSVSDLAFIAGIITEAPRCAKRNWVTFNDSTDNQRLHR